MRLANFYNAIGALRSGALTHPPVIIVGTGRCGTTLLFRILKTHPQVAVFPTEANDLWHPKAYPYRNRRIETPSIGADPAEFTRRSRAAWPIGHGERIKRVFSGFQFVRGRDRRFFVQSAMICHLLPTILELWPMALVVHLVRDGRPTVLSLTEKNFSKRISAAENEEAYRVEAARYWRDSVLEIEKSVRNFGLDESRFLQIRYEDLCADPSAEIGRLSLFTGIQPDRFAFDFNEIESRNFKAEFATTMPGWKIVYDILAPVLERYGYI